MTIDRTSRSLDPIDGVATLAEKKLT